MDNNTNAAMNEDLGTGLDWNAEISKESEFELLPPGTYDFTVEDMQRGEFQGSQKMSRCYKSDLTLRVSDPTTGKSGRVFDTLYLNSKAEWRLSQFFTSIGQKKHGEPLRMDWNKVVGSTGKLKLTIKKYTSSRTGEDRENNRVSEYLAPAVQKAWAPGDGF
jgi:hypothetical protein